MTKTILRKELHVSMLTKWDSFFLGLAQYMSTASKDPSTKVGAVVVRSDRTVASVGYNGFPRGVVDYNYRYEDRELKYPMVVHAEANAVVHARESLCGMVLYTYPFPPCSNCAGLIIQSGISKVIAPMPTKEQSERWGDNMKITEKMFQESNVELLLIDNGDA